jgi:hypothetical protein
LLQPATLANKASATTKCGTRIVTFSLPWKCRPTSQKIKLGSLAQERKQEAVRHW